MASRETLGNDFFSQLTDFAAGQGFIAEVDFKKCFLPHIIRGFVNNFLHFYVKNFLQYHFTEIIIRSFFNSVVLSKKKGEIMNQGDS